jgi:hypothetical protein
MRSFTVLLLVYLVSSELVNNRVDAGKIVFPDDTECLPGTFDWNSRDCVPNQTSTSKTEPTTEGKSLMETTTEETDIETTTVQFDVNMMRYLGFVQRNCAPGSRNSLSVECGRKPWG